MRKPNLAEMIIISYAFYMWFTLTIDNDWFYSAIQENPESMYAAYLNFFHTQGNLAITSLVVGFLTVGILFIENYIFRIFVNVIGLAYFTILAASYIFSYPNLGLGLSAIITVIMIANINRLIDEQQEARKHKIMCDSYKERGDTDDTNDSNSEEETKEG